MQKVARLKQLLRDLQFTLDLQLREFEYVTTKVSSAWDTLYLNQLRRTIVRKFILRKHIF